MKGFTLIELIIVVALLSILLVLVAPVTLKFFKAQNLTSATSTLLSSLRNSHSEALFQKNDSSFGIKFLPSSYVMFQGESYATRNTAEDIVITPPSSITISGVDEIVFAKRTGLPSSTGIILIQSGTKSSSVVINEQGVIEIL